MSKDWTSNKKTTFTTLGASNHTDHERSEGTEVELIGNMREE